MRLAFVSGILGLLLLGIALSAGCGGGGSSQPPPQKTLTSIAVTPATPSIADGTTQQFNATGKYSDGSSTDLTTAVTWSSSQTSVATISNATGSQGFASGVGAGASLISATSGSVSGSTTLTVTTATLQSISVTPANPSVANGTAEQFTATGHFSDNTTQDLTTSVTWSSSKTSIATISNAAGSQGLATSVGTGTTTISATSGSVSGSTTLTVTTATLQSISVTPSNPSVANGTAQQFTATGHFSDNTTQDLTSSVTWSSSKTSVATISNTSGSQGLATSVGTGTTTISATSGSVSGSTTLTVTGATLQSITVAPPNPSIPVGTTQQFTATGHYSDGNTQDLTTSVGWNSSDTTVAMISNSNGAQGLATGLKAGTVTITALLDTVSGTADLTVTTPANTSVWTQDGPAARFSQSGVFDDTTKQMIVFGGQDTVTHAALGDLWVISTGTDKHLRASNMTANGTGPAARFGHTAVDDAASNRMTIFGGGSSVSSCTNDVWVLDGANGQSGSPTWIQLTPSGGPSARMLHNAVYDSNTNSMIVFGGSDCNGGYLNDVWVLSSANGEGGTPTWTELLPMGTPPTGREAGSAIYDAANNAVVIYGGDAGGTAFGDVWTLSNANGSGGTPAWTSLSPGGTPPSARSGHSAFFDSMTNRMVVFGGVNAASDFGDVWYLSDPSGNGATPAWTQVTTTGTAPTLYAHSAVYDSLANAMYVFAGTSTGTKLKISNHTFVLSRANANGLGSSIWAVSGPPVRYSQSAFYDSATNSLFVFGGQHATSDINFNDYWKNTGVIGTTGVDWSNLNISGNKPTARFGHTVLYDSVSNRMMLFGGAIGFPDPCTNDYWVLQQANAAGGSPSWVSVTPSETAPAARTNYGAAYDAGTNSLILFGGFDCTSTYFNDVWVLNNANSMSGTQVWTQLSPTGTPPSPREVSSVVYDPGSNALIVFGGDADFFMTTGTPFGDIWILSNANGTGGTPEWTELTPTNVGPAARSGHTAIYDAANNRMTIYGGFDGTNILSDTWVLAGANGQAGPSVWISLSPTPEGPLRRFHSAVYDPVSNEMLIFGGISVMDPLAPDANMFSLTVANGQP